MDEFEREYADLAAAYRRASETASSAEGRRRARADYDEAVRDVAMRQQASARQVQPQAEVRRREPTLGESARGYARAAVQGATFGFGEEAEALARSLAGGAPYAQGVERIRGEMREFREMRPKSAIAAELAGGLATGGIGAGRAAAGAAGRSIIPRTLKLAAGQGALAGAGTAEGGVGERLAGATIGGIAGGAVGGTLGAAAGGLGRVVSRVRAGGRARPSVAIGAVERMGSAAGIEDIPAAIRRAAETGSPETRVMDVLGRPGARMASGLRLVGGQPGEEISNVMQQRLATRPERLTRGLYGSRTAENVTETVDDLIAQRRAVADPLYEAALGARNEAGLREAPVIADEAIESFLNRPLFQRAVKQAEEDILNAGGRMEYVDIGNGQRVPARTPEFLDNVKKALDDIIYRGRQPGEGGFGPGQLARAKEVRANFVNLLDEAIPGYAEARAAWAGPTALKGALEDGLDAATGRVEANALSKTVNSLSSSEQEFFRRGYIERIRQRIDDGQLKPNEIRTPGFEKRMQAVFGDDADAIVSQLREEMALDESATRILRGSPTAERLQDVAEVEGGSFAGRAIRATGEPIRTAARAADWLEARLRGGLTERRRGAVASALMTPASAAEPLLAALAREQRAQRVGRAVETPATAALSRLFGGRTVEQF